VATIAAPACAGDSGTTPPPTHTPPIAASFTLSAPKLLTVLQGGGGEATIAITRTGGFAGNVALAVAGAPAGVTATITPSIASGTTATLVVTTSAEAPADTLALTISGTSLGQSDRTISATVAITPYTGGTGNVSLDFASCPTSKKPIWVAYQDGDGAWTQILGTSDAYRFNVASARGGYAFVSRDLTATLTVWLATRAELTRSTNLPCGVLAGAQKQLSGTVTGLGGGEVAYVGLGGTYSDPEGGPVAGPFTLFGVHDGSQDLIAYRSSAAAFSTRERVIVRRDQNIANNGTLGMLDFDGGEPFAPATASVTVTGIGSSQAAHYMAYYAGAQCSYYDLYDDASIGGSFLMRGIPSPHQRPSEFHGLMVYAPNPTRYALETFHTIADRVVALPAPLTAPTITAPPGGHKRIQVSLTLPDEYQESLYLALFFQRAAAYMTASIGWLGGASATLALPDFSVVTGWSGSFLPTSDASSRWFMAATGSNVVRVDARSTCVENGRFVSAYTNGEW
jgi:hypothetical protein